MQKWPLLLTAILFFQLAQAQNSNIDSMLAVLKVSKPDTNKVNLLRNIGVSLAHKDPQKAIDYWKEGVKLSRQLGYDMGLARSYINIGTGYTFQGKYDTAALYTDSAILYCHKINDQNRLALSYLNRGDIYRNLGDYRNALKYCDTALIYAEQTGNTDRRARIFDIIADIYAAQLQYQPAIVNLQKALELYIADENDIMEGQVYSDFADIYKSMGKMDSAISYYRRAIQIGEKAEDFKNLSTYHAELGDLYITTGNHKEAEVQILRSLEYARDQENNLQLSTAHTRLAKLYLNQRRYDDAVKMGKLGHQYAVAENHIGHQQETAALIAEAYMGLNDHTNANKYLLLSRDLNDSLLKQRFHEEIAGLQNSFEVKEKDKEILLLNKEKELQDQRLSRQRVIIAGSVVLGVLAIVGIILLISRYRLRNRMKELELRNRIAADLHDEVGSSLSSIHMLSQMATQKQEAGSHLEILARMSTNAKETMDKMGDIVWMIKPGESEGTNLKQRMERFAHEIGSSREIVTEINLEELERTKFSMEQRKNIYLIFKEALNNAAKYSGAEKITVDVSVHNRQIVMRISDNGKGFEQVTAANGNGLGNMRNRAADLEGKLGVESENGEGTTITLTVPV
jgi:two-component system sensor histidine kinase UhpB